MQNKREQTIDGVTYEKSIPVELGLCTGCVANDNASLCAILARDCKGVIWIKKETNVSITNEEPKYTVEEVLEAVDQVTDDYLIDWQRKRIFEILARKDNPEYQQYLELKAKFGE